MSAFDPLRTFGGCVLGLDVLEPHPEFMGSRFRLDGGDGDQTLFGAYMLLERVKAPWFTERPNHWLMQVIGGANLGLVFAISPRTLGAIEVGIEVDGGKGVIVSGLPEQHGCEALLYPAGAIGGMTYIKCIRVNG